MGRRLLLPDIGVRLINRQPPVPLTHLSVGQMVMGGGGVPAVPLLDPKGDGPLGDPIGDRRGRNLVPRRWLGVGRGALTRSSGSGSGGRANRLLVLGQPGGVNGPRRRCRRYAPR